MIPFLFLCHHIKITIDLWDHTHSATFSFYIHLVLLSFFSTSHAFHSTWTIKYQSNFLTFSFPLLSYVYLLKTLFSLFFFFSSFTTFSYPLTTHKDLGRTPTYLNLLRTFMVAHTWAQKFVHVDDWMRMKIVISGSSKSCNTERRRRRWRRRQFRRCLVTFHHYHISPPHNNKYVRPHCPT